MNWSRYLIRHIRQCFHDTEPIFLCIDEVWKTASWAPQKILAIFERFSPPSWSVSPQFFNDLFRFCTVIGVMETQLQFVQEKWSQVYNIYMSDFKSVQLCIDLKMADWQQGFPAACLMSASFFWTSKQKNAAGLDRTVALAAASAVLSNCFLIERSLKLHSKAFLSLRLDLIQHAAQLTSNILGGPRAGQALPTLPLPLCLHQDCPLSAL